VDRLKIANACPQRPADLPPLNICMQVNVSGEASKSGCAPATCRPGPRRGGPARLRLRGLMAIPEPTEDAPPSAPPSPPARAASPLNLGLDTLSMGMSHDLEAHRQGATWCASAPPCSAPATTAP
jgi:uncharacterized pyridoxal phosphate-containing UPF0001 family protein